MTIIDKILTAIGNAIGANPSSLTTTNKTIVGAINELDAEVVPFTPSTTSSAGSAGLVPVPYTIINTDDETVRGIPVLTLEGWRRLTFDVQRSSIAAILFTSLKNIGDNQTLRSAGYTLQAASSSHAGVMAATDKIKLDALPNIHVSTTNPASADGVDGDIWIVYE